jgi:outer membrane protein TolC
MLKKIKWFLVVLIWSEVAMAQAQKFTLDEARAYGIENRKTMSIADLEILSAQKKVLEVTAQGLPQINAEGTFQEYLNIPTSVVDASFINPNAPPGSTVSFRMGTQYSMIGGISASQLLFDGSYFVGLQVSKHVADFVSMNKDQVAWDIQYQISQAYFNVLVAQANVRVMDSIVLSTETLFRKMEKMKSIGFVEQQDVDQLEMNWSRAGAMLSNANRMLKISKTLLKMHMGYPYEQEIELDADLAFYMNKMILEYGEMKGSVEQNMQLILLEKRKEISQYELKNTQFAYFPQLSAFFQHQYMAFRNEFNFFQGGDWFPSTAWGVSLRVPIFSGGARHSRVQQAKIDVMKRELEISETKRMLQFQEIRLIQDFESAIDQLRIEEKNLELALRIYNNTISKKEIGTNSTLDVTQVYSQVLNAQAEYIRACSTLLNTKTELDNLYGTFNKIIESK